MTDLRHQIAEALSALSTFSERFREWCAREPLTFEIGDYHPPCGAIYDKSKPHFCIRDLVGRCDNTSCALFGLRRILDPYGNCRRCGTANVRERAAAWPLALVLSNSTLAAVVSLDMARRRQQKEQIA